MITPKEAVELVKKETKYNYIVTVKDYDDQHYVVEAHPDDKKLRIGIQTTFGVDKNTGEVTGFNLNQGDCLDRYLAAKVCGI